MAPESSTDRDPRRTQRALPREPAILAVELSRFSVGDQLDLSLHAGKQSGRVAARVVRVEENGRDSAEVWRYRLAVELDGTLPEDLLAEARARAPLAQAGC